MKKFLSEKPWYFAFVALSFILDKFLEWIITFFFPETAVELWLDSTIVVKSIMPWIFAIIILFVCLTIYIIQLRHEKNRIVTPDELETLNHILIKAVDENEYIESMQAFQYRIKNGPSEKYIKLCYLAGAANERIEINTILQTYFYFTYPLYKKISIASSWYEDYIKESDPNKKDAYWLEFTKVGNQLCNQILDTLNGIKNVSEIKEYHCDIYRVLAKFLPTLSNEAFESFLENNEIEHALIKHKKTGVLGALVINDLYIFKNQNSVTKSDRIYFAFQYNNQKNILFLGSINGSCITSDNTKNIETYCKSIVTALCEKNQC